MLNVNPLAGLVSFLIVAALLGGIAFLGFSNSDLANYNTSAAQARAMDRQTELNAQKTEIDLNLYKELEEAKAQAEKEKIQLDLNSQREQMVLSLEHVKSNQQRDMQKQQALDQVQLEFERAIRYTVLIVIGLVAVALSTGLLVLMVQFARTRFPVKQVEFSPAPSYEPAVTDERWHKDTAWRAEQVALARKREQVIRTTRQHDEKEQSLDYIKLFQAKRSDTSAKKL